jgi:hypothetical protein
MNNKQKVFIAGRKLGFDPVIIRNLLTLLGAKPTHSEVKVVRATRLIEYNGRLVPYSYNCELTGRDCDVATKDVAIQILQAVRSK